MQQNKKVYYHTLSLLLLAAIGLGAEELPFDKLAEAAYPQEVVVRGFLYHTPNGDWVLAAEPNLKSCCQGAGHKVDRQIFVGGDIGQPEPGRVYSLKGFFSKNPVYDTSGNVVQLYHLQNVRQMATGSYLSPFVLLLICLALAILFCALLKAYRIN